MTSGPVVRRILTVDRAHQILTEHGTWMTKGEIVDCAGTVTRGAADVLQILVDRGDVVARKLPKNAGSVLHFGVAGLVEARSGPVPPAGRPRTQIGWIEWGIAELDARPTEMALQDRTYLEVVIGQLRDGPLPPARGRLVDRCESLLGRTKDEFQTAVECGSVSGVSRWGY